MGKAIPKYVKETVWNKWVGANKPQAKCWAGCEKTIGILSFEAGHNIPRSKGGSDDVSNLRPVCSTCNKGMGDRYSIVEWKAQFYSGKSKRTSVAKKAKPITQTELVRKAQSHLAKKGYSLSQRRHNFDLLTEKGILKYLGVGSNVKDEVTEAYVRAFIKKIGDFYYTLGTGTIEGLVAHTGRVKPGARALVKGQKPMIKFQKFQ